MATPEFDSKFEKRYTELVELAFEFVGNNKNEVDEIFIFTSLEEGFFFNVFYRINGHLAELHNVNTYSSIQYDVSRDRMMSLLRLGTRCLRSIAQLFKEDDREMPTQMRICYNPKSGAFKNDISYETYISDDPEKTEADVFNEWFEKIKSSVN